MAGRDKAGAAPPAGRRARRGGGAKEPTLADEIAASGESEASAEELAEREIRDDLVFLAREFLTWLVWHGDVEGGAFAGSDEVAEFTVAFGGKMTLRSPAGVVTDMVLKGPAPASSADLRYALAGGLAVKEADLVLEQSDRVFSFALAAEHFDLKRVKLPALLDEETDDPGDERMQLLGQLDRAVANAFAEFLAIRTRPAWQKDVLPAIRDWLTGSTRA